MPDEPESLGEIARLLRTLQSHTDRQFDALNLRLDKLVTAELHALHVQHTEHRINTLANGIASERQDRVESVAEEARARSAAASNNASRMDRMENRQMWAWGAIALPIALFIVTIILTVRG